jgi:Flp pilus assembly protein TadG
MGRAGTLWSDRQGAVAPTVALSLFGLIAAGGLAFDYAHLASLDTELQQAADQAALAAATQLDGTADARVRATAAATQIVTNYAMFANDGTNRVLSGMTVAFCSAYDDDIADLPGDSPAAPTGCTVATSDADANVAVVTMASRQAYFALTSVVGAFSSGNMSARAAAHVGSAICKVPPVMICNPDEPVGNTNELLDYNPARGTGLRLVTGNATVPGNFGWLEAGLGNGTPALAGQLGYNQPLGPCQAISGVTTKTGMDTAVLNAFNTRFDVYANGNSTCPNQFGGTCSPSVNVRKDLTCEPNNAGTGCKNDTWSWVEPPVNPNPGQALPVDGSADPLFMGYPRDLMHTGPVSGQSTSIAGNAVWDVNAYFRVNYQINEAAWRTLLGVATGIPARYDVYLWEINHPNGTNGRGISIPQPAGSSGPPPKDRVAFSYPATGRAGVSQDASQPDRRTIAAAVLNCRALNVNGKTTNVPVPTWLKLFLVEPAFQRTNGPTKYTDQKDIYVEFLEKSEAQDDDFEEVVRRDVPYLIK